MAVQPQEAIRPMSVLELNTRIHELLAMRYQSVVVKGEVNGVSLSGGHVWFVLKDPGARLDAVIFSSTARRLPFLPQDGQELVVTGQVDYHAQSGRMKLVVSRLDYDGAGKMREATERLKRRLEAEGAFDPSRKRPLPFLPRSVALITSPSGAVIHDLQQTIWERFPNMSLYVYAAQVQGTASQRSLVAALRQCDRDGAADVCIVARGGGSPEELMAFNQEPVVRAVQAMHIPVVTALGHTSDRTLADLVADREARTPTAAAELVVPRKRDLLRQLEEGAHGLRRAARMALLGREQALTRRLATAPILQDPIRLLLVPAGSGLVQKQQALRRLQHDAVTRRRDPPALPSQPARGARAAPAWPRRAAPALDPQSGPGHGFRAAGAGTRAHAASPPTERTGPDAARAGRRTHLEGSTPAQSRHPGDAGARLQYLPGCERPGGPRKRPGGRW